MPVTKSAIKKLRKDRKREKLHDTFRSTLQYALRKAEKEKKAEDIKKAISLFDKAVKKHLLHKNKVARIKSRLSKLVKLPVVSSVSPVKKKTAKAKTPQKRKKP